MKVSVCWVDAMRSRKTSRSHDPWPPRLGAPGSAAGDEDDLVDDVVARDVFWGDPIIGEEENGGDGALNCQPCAGDEPRVAPRCGLRPLPSPKEMTPAAMPNTAFPTFHTTLHARNALLVNATTADTAGSRTRGRSRTRSRILGFSETLAQRIPTLSLWSGFGISTYISCVVDLKGPDPDVVARLARLLRECGLVHFTFRSDKE